MSEKLNRDQAENFEDVLFFGKKVEINPADQKKPISQVEPMKAREEAAGKPTLSKEYWERMRKMKNATRR